MIQKVPSSVWASFYPFIQFGMRNSNLVMLSEQHTKNICGIMFMKEISVVLRTKALFG